MNETHDKCHKCGHKCHYEEACKECINDVCVNCDCKNCKTRET